MDIAQKKEEVSHYQQLAETCRNLKAVMYGEAVVGIATLGYGVIDSVAEGEVNLAPTMLGFAMAVGGTVGILATSTLESVYRHNEAVVQEDLDRQIRQERHRANYAAKKAALIFQRRAKFGYQ